MSRADSSGPEVCKSFRHREDTGSESWGIYRRGGFSRRVSGGGPPRSRRDPVLD